MATRTTDLEAGLDRRPGKRVRLIESARDILFRQGVEPTTLMEIAEAADVPPGNVYYYFKTKDELVEAVIESHVAAVKGLLESLERHRTPRARLKAFVGMLADQAETTARFGCPQGTLCSELDKREGRLRGAAAELLRLPVDWAERQFRELGRRDARDLAFALVASYQGTALVTNAYRDPGLAIREARRLGRWIDSLA